MQSAPKGLLKEYVQSQQFTSTAEIMQAMKEMFRDVTPAILRAATNALTLSTGNFTPPDRPDNA